MAHHMSPGPVAEPQYSNLVTLTRSLHFDDFKLCYDQKKMIPRRIKMSKRSFLDGVGEVLWFGPSLPSTNDHNWYGNVSFIIDLQELVSRFGSNFYYVDKQEFETHVASRIVLSKNQNRFSPLPRVDTSSVGTPIKKEIFRSWEHVTSCKSSRFGTVLPHKLEIGIEADFFDCQWIYQQARIEANSHYLANTSIGFGSTTCHRHNTFGGQCPNPLTRDLAHQKLTKEFPLYLTK